MRRFENKSAVVTGASSGVGKAIALALAAEGATVAMLGRDEDKVRAVARQSGSPTSRAFASEFCDEGSVALVGQALARSFPTLDLLVHSAGMIKLGTIGDAPLEELDTHYMCNVRAPLALTQQLLPALVAARGTVVFLNSTVVDNPRSGVAYYAASKGALKAAADCLRDEVNARGVRVLSVFLGRTATPMQEIVCRSEKRTYDASKFIQPQDVATLVLNAVSSPHSLELTNLHVRPTAPLPALS